MRNLLGRLHARPPAELPRIAACWRVPLGGASLLALPTRHPAGQHGLPAAEKDAPVETTLRSVAEAVPNGPKMATSVPSAPPA